jgi:very-short-patch-repair endonuclease
LCGKIFYLPANRINAAKHYFCNLAHANEWQGRNKDAYTCIICGISFRWSPSRAKSNNVKYCSLACRDADPERTLLLRRMNAKQLEMHPNNLERTAYAMLDEIGIAYNPQYLIGDKFCVDAFVPSCNTVIQFDGDYWHGNPTKFVTLDHRQSRRVALDRSQDAYMKACGYHVLRIWESEIKRAPNHVKNLLRNALTQPEHTLVVLA